MKGEIVAETSFQLFYILLPESKTGYLLTLKLYKPRPCHVVLGIYISYQPDKWLCYIIEIQLKNTVHFNWILLHVM